MIFGKISVPYLFVHNPRTSGTSLTNFLVNYCLGNRYRLNNETESSNILHRAYAASNNKFDEYFKFGFCRNPFSRELSLYKLIIAENHVSFKEWIINRFSNDYDADLDKKFSYFRLPQYGYFCDLDGVVKVNVYKYEQRQTALLDIGNHLKIDLSKIYKYRPENNSPRFNIQEYHKEYDNEMIDLVEKAYKIDLDYFGYTFDGFKENLPVDFKFQGDVRYYSSNYVNPEVFYRYK